MKSESSLSRVETRAFETGYILDIKYEQDLNQREQEAKEKLKQKIQLRKMPYAMEEDIDTIPALERNLQRVISEKEAFLAGKRARLKDKTTEFKLEQRREEYLEERNKRQERIKKREKSVLLTIGHKITTQVSNYIQDMNKEFKDSVKEAAPWIPAVIGATMIFSSMLGAIEASSALKMKYPAIAFSSLTALSVGLYSFQKIHHKYTQHKIKQRQEADRQRGISLERNEPSKFKEEISLQQSCGTYQKLKTILKHQIARDNPNTRDNYEKYCKMLKDKISVLCSEGKITEEEGKKIEDSCTNLMLFVTVLICKEIQKDKKVGEASFQEGQNPVSIRIIEERGINDFVSRYTNLVGNEVDELMALLQTVSRREKIDIVRLQEMVMCYKNIQRINRYMPRKVNTVIKPKGRTTVTYSKPEDDQNSL